MVVTRNRTQIIALEIKKKSTPSISDPIPPLNPLSNKPDPLTSLPLGKPYRDFLRHLTTSTQHTNHAHHVHFQVTITSTRQFHQQDAASTIWTAHQARQATQYVPTAVTDTGCTGRFITRADAAVAGLPILGRYKKYQLSLTTASARPNTERSHHITFPPPHVKLILSPRLTNP